MIYFVHPRERRVLWLAYVIAALVATYVCAIARECNNFHIFRSAFVNLLQQRDLYAAHPGQHWDLFKYSPTFAFLFAPFALAPFALGLLAWNLLNVLLVFVAVARLLPVREGTIALLLLYPGLAATLDGTQSNGIVAALIVLGWLGFERRDPRAQMSAALAIAAGALVKVFPLAALSFAAVHNRRARFAITFTAVFTALVAVPLLVTSPSTLGAQYASWFALEQVDALDRGASVMRLLHRVVGYGGPNWPVQLAGTALLLAPLLRLACREGRSLRRDFLCSLLVYSVIFNHKAEQSSFIIALVGIVVRYAANVGRSARSWGWKTTATAATLLAMPPVFIGAVAPEWLGPYADLPLLMAAACATLVWLSMQYELLGVAAIADTARRRLVTMRGAEVVTEE